ncbi:cholesterol transporter ABCA5-like [Panulirus ornatus]|uniref:cholesterol transporter ABCA5-like n=1 Tax=Panulirus ornatus TaxID=150431 RepID=UPI003A8A0793
MEMKTSSCVNFESRMTSDPSEVNGRTSQTAWTACHDDNGYISIDKNIGKGGFVDQIKALIIRNLTIKMRDRRKTLTELFMPLYWIVILSIVRLIVPDSKDGPILKPHGSAPLMSSLNIQDLHVVPNNTEVRNIVDEIEKLASSYFAEIDVTYHNTEDALIDVFKHNTSVSVAVVFSEDTVENKSYVLRYNPALIDIPSPSHLWSDRSSCRDRSPEYGLQLLNCPPNGYYFSGFSALQTLIDVAIIRKMTDSEVKVPEVVLQNFPKGSFESGGVMVLRNIVPLYMVFAWAQFIVYMMMLVVEEKERKIKESMKMMGLRDSVYWLSWFAVYGAYVLALALVCIILLPLAQVFRHADLFLLFILLVLYGFSSIVFALMLTPFFNKSKVAGVVANLIQVFLSLLFYLQVYMESKIDQGVFWALALLSPCAFSFAIDKVIVFDYSSGGLNYNMLWDGPGLPVAGSLIMIAFDIFLYLFLAYYFDNVIPSEYGTKRKPWFLFQKSFWVTNNKTFQFVSMERSDNEGFEDTEPPANSDVEPVSSELCGKIAVCIRNLKKTYHPSGKEPVKAVDGFSLDIYEGQITAILGHNGAGKTTLFNILTGMTSPSEGYATIFGMDISFYIQGVSSDKLDAEVNRTLEEVDLSSKQDTRASDLSGGQKRKLSIGIALIGDPKVIFLDEPTAGVDAYSRRRLWTLLKKRKEGKVILLTTHFMDEADILADRKAIMSRGKLRCCGSSLFLKNKFGLGYHLTLVVAEDADADVITKAVKTVVPGVQIARFYGKEMSFILPSDSTREFPKLFLQLDHHITSAEENIAIEGYGISMTTLEEVFLTLSEENDDDELQAVEDLSHHIVHEMPSSTSHHKALPDLRHHRGYEMHNSDSKGFAISSVEVSPDVWRAFKALLKMRILNFTREIVAVILLVLLPLGFITGSIALAKSQVIQLPSDKTLHLSPEIYEPKLDGTLLHDASESNLTALESVFQSVNMPVNNYSGNYEDISSLGMHMSAFNVQSFLSTENVNLTNLTIAFNDTYMHSIPILVNLLNNALLRSLGESDMINISTQFLPRFTGNAKFDVSSFFAPMMIGMAFTMIPASLSIELVHDREIMARNMLRLNGVGFNLYFSSFILVIGAVYLVAYIGLLIIIAAFNVPSLTIQPAFGAIAVLYLLYMPSAILFSAVFCYIFDKAETARQFYPNLASTLGFMSYTAVSLVDTLVVTDDDIHPSLILHIVLAVFVPFYVPFGLLYFINKIFIGFSLNGTCSELTTRCYMTTEIIVLFVIILIDIPLYYILLRLADTLKLGGSWRDALWIMKKKESGNSCHIDEAEVDALPGEDDDVKEERANIASVMNNGGAVPPVLIYNLGKVYKKGVEGGQNLCKKEKKTKDFVALKSVSLGVKYGQVFGLLGPNGAGKTTCLRIITAEEGPTKGRVKICGEEVLSSLSNIFETMGYCPQHDALWKNITVAEHIECYAEVRGVRKDQVKLLVDTYVKGLEIEEHKKKMSKDCSGGTKRKLSYIISMIGSPQVVLLDEPSTGMDPKSKRFLWNSILASFKGQRSAILTTHSMEEADALCSRIGILVQGGLRCVGAIQHLKNKYGGGYNLEIKVKNLKSPFVVTDVNSSSLLSSEEPSNAIEQLQDLVKETFPNAVLDEQFEERIIYKVPQRDVTSLAGCFGMLEKAKTEGLVEEYALSQTTLEQVFLQFARQQEEVEDEDEVSSS